MSSFLQLQIGQLDYNLCFCSHITTPVGTMLLNHFVINIFSCNHASLRALPRTSQCMIVCSRDVGIFNFFEIRWSTLECRIDLYRKLWTFEVAYIPSHSTVPKPKVDICDTAILLAKESIWQFRNILTVSGLLRPSGCTRTCSVVKWKAEGYQRSNIIDIRSVCLSLIFD